MIHYPNLLEILYGDYERLEDVEEKYKLFKRFSRIETEELLSRKGSGIGLFISWNIVYMHNGRIYADSAQGQYAEFTVELPLP